MILNHKLVFHIPCKYWNGIELIDIKEISNVIHALIIALNDFSVSDSFYISNITGIYKNRIFPEKTITMFCESEIDETIEIYINWFKRYNDILKQEALSYELDNQMIILNL